MKALLVIAAVLLGPSTGWAQIPEPPEELSKLAPLLGNWEGSGTAREVPDGPQGSWDSVMTVKKIMGGHAFQEDVKVSLGAEVPAPLVLRTIYWWDAPTKRFRHFAMSNVGFGGSGTYYAASGKKLVGSTTRIMSGVPVTEHVVTDLSEDGVLKFVMKKSMDGGEFFTSVKGTYKRGGDGFTVDEKTADMVLLPPPEEMAEVEKDVGTWTIKGKMSPMPGMSFIPISARQTFQPMVGRHAYMGTIQGDPTPGSPMVYRSVSYLAWDPENACMLGLDLDNFGTQTLSYGYLTEDEKRVYLSKGMAYGAPTVYRTLVEPLEGHDKQKVTVHRMTGDAAPDLYFEAEVQRVKETGEAKASESKSE